MDRKFYAAAALLIVAMASCAPGDRDATPATPAAPAATSAGATPTLTTPARINTASALDTAQNEALAFLIAINEQHVAAAEQARGKKIDARVRAYADMLHAQHMQGLEQTQAMAAAAGAVIKDSGGVSAFRARGLADLERMAALDEDDYADAYLEAMANGNAEAMVLIDDRLLPAATDEAVRLHLTATRGHMAQHLRAARELQGQPQ